MMEWCTAGETPAAAPLRPPRIPIVTRCWTQDWQNGEDIVTWRTGNRLVIGLIGLFKQLLTILHKLLYQKDQCSQSVFFALLSNVSQQCTLVCFRIHVLAVWRPTHTNLLLFQLSSHDYLVTAAGSRNTAPVSTAQETPFPTLTSILRDLARPVALAPQLCIQHICSSNIKTCLFFLYTVGVILQMWDSILWLILILELIWFVHSDVSQNMGGER
jgi:hypothetical protein